MSAHIKDGIEYHLYIYVDEYADVEGDFEFEEDKVAAYNYGMYGYVLRAEKVTDDGFEARKELDSCWGFIGMPDMVKTISEHYSSYLPEGVTPKIHMP